MELLEEETESECKQDCNGNIFANLILVHQRTFHPVWCHSFVHTHTHCGIALRIDRSWNKNRSLSFSPYSCATIAVVDLIVSVLSFIHSSSSSFIFVCNYAFLSFYHVSAMFRSKKNGIYINFHIYDIIELLDFKIWSCTQHLECSLFANDPTTTMQSRTVCIWNNVT